MSKELLAIVASFLVVVGSYPYVRDILLKKAKPHIYTWLIWSFTQGTTTMVAWQAGAGWGIAAFAIGFAQVCIVLLLSLFRGTKDITTYDTVVLCIAAVAIVVWWQMHSVLWPLIIATGIDVMGYIPTWRKTLRDPSSESMRFWLMMACAALLSIAANAQYNLFTVLYPFAILCSNLLVAVAIFVGKRPSLQFH